MGVGAGAGDRGGRDLGGGSWLGGAGEGEEQQG